MYLYPRPRVYSKRDWEFQKAIGKDVSELKKSLKKHSGLIIDREFDMIQHGTIKQIKSLIKHQKYDWNYLMAYACSAKDNKFITIIKFTLRKGANQFDWGFKNACGGGNMKFINLMIKMGATNLTSGFHNACANEHLEPVKLMMSKGMKFFCHRCRDLPKYCEPCKQSKLFLIEKNLQYYTSTKIKIGKLMIKDMRYELCRYIKY